jgi:hypothetical protein
MAAETRTTLALDVTRMTVVREISGQIAADSTTETDANFPPEEALDCRGFDTIWVSVEIAGGASPTCTLEPLFRDEGAADGFRWHRTQTISLDGAPVYASPADQQTSALQTSQQYELRVDGWPKVYLRRVAVTNSGSTTAMKILARPGRTRPARGNRFP